MSTPEQERQRTSGPGIDGDGYAAALRRQGCVHEAGHATAGFLLGWRIIHVTVGEDGRRKGSAKLQPREAEPLVAALESIVVSLAGDIAVRSAVPAAVGITTVRTTPDVEELLLLAPVALGPEGAYGCYPDSSDVTRAEETARAVCTGELEALHFLTFARLRATSLVRSERFQTLVTQLAHELDGRGHLTGAAATAELARSNQTFEKEPSHA